MNEFITRFILGVLATWRISHLVAREDGPADLLARVRVRLGSGFAGKLMDCFECLSLWVAVPIAFFVAWKPVDLLLTWLALSGAACLLERAVQEPVVIQPISQITEGDNHDGMLRSNTNNAAEHPVAADDRHTPRDTGAD